MQSNGILRSEWSDRFLPTMCRVASRQYAFQYRFGCVFYRTQIPKFSADCHHGIQILTQVVISDFKRWQS